MHCIDGLPTSRFISFSQHPKLSVYIHCFSLRYFLDKFQPCIASTYYGCKRDRISQTILNASLFKKYLVCLSLSLLQPCSRYTQCHNRAGFFFLLSKNSLKAGAAGLQILSLRLEGPGNYPPPFPLFFLRYTHTRGAVFFFLFCRGSGFILLLSLFYNSRSTY